MTTKLFIPLVVSMTVDQKIDGVEMSANGEERGRVEMTGVNCVVVMRNNS